MARQEINLGAAPTGAGGDTTRSTAVKINAMTLELYQGIGTPSAPLPVSQGGTGGTSQATAQAGLGLIPVATLSENVGGRLVTTGWAGLGGALAQRAYTPDQSFNTISGGSFSYANAGGAFPSGVTDGALINMGYDTAGQFAYQILGDWRTGYMYRRGRAGAVSGAWGMVYDSVNAFIDPATGGLMSSTVVNGFTVTKYASGIMNIVGPAGVTGSLAANNSTPLDITIPSGLISINYATGFCAAIPTLTFETYGIVAQYLLNITTLRLVIRNGATAQTYTITVNVWGRWK